MKILALPSVQCALSLSEEVDIYVAFPSSHGTEKFLQVANGKGRCMTRKRTSRLIMKREKF